MDKPEKLEQFMRALMDSASQYSLVNYLNNKGISKEEFFEIDKWFRGNFDIKL